MAFIYEQLNEAESLDMKKKVEPFQMLMSFIDGQVIDRDKDVVFLDLGGQGYQPPDRGEPPNYYALNWKGAFVAYEGYYRTEYYDSEIRMNVNLVRLRVPEILKSELVQLQQFIEDAMSVYWQKLQSSPNRKILLTISFPEPTYY